MSTDTAQPPDTAAYPVVSVGTSRTHAAWSIDRTGALYETFCGLALQRFAYAPAPTSEGVTCKRCRRSLWSRAEDNRMARRTLQLGEEGRG